MPIPVVLKDKIKRKDLGGLRLSSDILDKHLGGTFSLQELVSEGLTNEFNELVNDKELKELISSGKADLFVIVDCGLVQRTRIAKVYSDADIIAMDEKGALSIKDRSTMDLFGEDRIKSLLASKLRSLREMGQCSDQDLRTYVNQGVFSRDELMQYGIISKKDIDRVVPIPVNIPFGEWSKVPDLMEDRVDVFTFGFATSGKSCMLAGVFRYAQKSGKFRPFVNNQGGFLYLTALTKAVGKNLLPPATAVEFVQFMAADLIDDDGDVHPLTFIEMSGELFEACMGKSISETPPKMQEYFFHNPNHKILIFAVDFSLGDTQEMNFFFILKFLEENKMLDTVYSIALVVTKWDCSPDRSNEAALRFVKENYKLLHDFCEDLEKKYGLVYNLLKFSLGEFTDVSSYVYDSTDSEKLFAMLCKSPIVGGSTTKVQQTDKKNWWDKFKK